jgi:hypothetical protein
MKRLFWNEFECAGAGALFWSDAVQEEYAARHGHRSDVQFNDVCFALHAMALTLVTVLQCFVYQRGGQTLSRGCAWKDGETLSWGAHGKVDRHCHGGVHGNRR